MSVEKWAVGLVLPSLPLAGCEMRDLGAHAARAEAAGAASVWVTDHLFWHAPCVEAMSACALLAAATTTCLVGPCVLQLPLRSTAATAKASSYLNHLSDGRFVLGLGVGERRNEFELAQVEFGTRGARLEQMLDDMREMWTSTEAPSLRPGGVAPPVWIGGSSRAARDRAARIGDGWIPMFVRPERLAADLRVLDAEIAGHSDRDASFERAVVVFVSLEDDDRVHPRNVRWLEAMFGRRLPGLARHVVSGSAASCAAALARFQEAGATHLVVGILGDDPLPRFEALMEAGRGVWAGTH